jgi:hypothetical protein
MATHGCVLNYKMGMDSQKEIHACGLFDGWHLVSPTSRCRSGTANLSGPVQRRHPERLLGEGVWTVIPGYWLMGLLSQIVGAQISRCFTFQVHLLLGKEGELRCANPNPLPHPQAWSQHPGEAVESVSILTEAEQLSGEDGDWCENCCPQLCHSTGPCLLGNGLPHQVLCWAALWPDPTPSGPSMQPSLAWGRAKACSTCHLIRLVVRT